MADWFTANAPTQQGDWFTQNAPQQLTGGPVNAPGTPFLPSFGEQAQQYAPGTLTPENEAGLEQQFSQEHPYIYGVAKGITGMVPKSLDDLKQMLRLPMPSHDVEQEQAASEQLGAEWRGEYGPTEQAASITGTALQALPLLGLASAKSPFRATPSDAALVEQFRQAQAAEKPPVQPEAPPAEVAPEPDLQWQGDPVVQDNLRTGEANAKLETPGQPPAPATEEATQAPPNVREALSLDEIRLMREKSDLQLQQDLAKRATGTSHPAIDDRITQIDDELDNIANRELQPSTPEIPPDVQESLRQPAPRAKVVTDLKQIEADLRPSTTAVTIPADEQKYAGTSPELQARNAQAGQNDTAPVESASVGSSEARGISAPERPGSGTSNRAFSETYGQESVPSGEGVDTTELLDNARAAVRSGAVDPYSVLSRTRSNGIANAEEYASLAAEHERLVNNAVAKQKTGAPDAPQAAKEAEEFANAIQPHKTAASDLMRLFQGDIDYDLSTPFGMEQYMKAEIHRGMKPGERPRFNRMSSDIGRAQTDVQRAVARSDVRVQRHYANVRDIPIEEAAARVREWLKDCVV